jgi:hypothetical protein
MEHHTPFSRSSHDLRHRDIAYTIVQGEGRLWKWSALVDGVTMMGLATSRSEAVAGAESAIDQALAPNGRT